MSIYKHVITLTILSEVDDLSGLTLEELGRSIDKGEDIGSFRITSRDAVPDDKLHDELLAVGNDGSFFRGLDH